jgi:hypothetical protein
MTGKYRLSVNKQASKNERLLLETLACLLNTQVTFPVNTVLACKIKIYYKYVIR